MGDFFLALTSLCISVFSMRLWSLSIKRVEIPQNRNRFVTAWAAAAGLGIVALLGEPGWLGGTLAALGTFSSLFLLFTIAISRQKVGPEAIQVGSTIPVFSAIDENGDPFHSQSLAGHPVLIKFFRAHW